MSGSGAPLPKDISPPAEYVTFVLCRLLHCLPSQLREESYRDVVMILQCMATEAEMEKQKDNALDPATRGAG